MSLSRKVVDADHAKEISGAMKEKNIAEAAGRKLWDYYPGYDWHVEACMKAGILRVRNLNLDGNYGFEISLQRHILDIEMKQLIWAGGEILERYNLKRGKIQDGYSVGLEKDIHGSFMGDRS